MLVCRLRRLCRNLSFYVHLLRITGKFPGYLSPSAGLKFADVPNGLAAISKVPAAGWGQILAYMAFCEVSQDQSPGTPAAAGDFGFKVLTSSDPAEKTKKLSAELANGRLAMMAIIGMFFQERVEQRPCKFVKHIQHIGMSHVNRCMYTGWPSLAAPGAIGPITPLRPCADALEAGICPHGNDQKR